MACFRLDIAALEPLSRVSFVLQLFLFRSAFSVNHTGGHGPALLPPARRRCCFFACCNAAASVSECEAALSPTTTTKHTGREGGFEARRGSSSSAVAGARTTCRINGGRGGENFPSLVPSRSPPRHRQRFAFCFFIYFFSLPLHALCLLRCSPSARAAPTSSSTNGPRRELPPTRVANT